MRTQEHVLAEISQVMGAGIPMRMFFLKCDAVGLPDEAFRSGEKDECLLCHVGGCWMAGGAGLPLFSLICPQEVVLRSRLF